jgi:hypothetical protein
MHEPPGKPEVARSPIGVFHAEALAYGGWIAETSVPTVRNRYGTLPADCELAILYAVDEHLPVNPEQARHALEEVLASATLARSDQLRSFLRYVGERTLAGGGREINEYSVAVEALGKPSGFSPAEDSSVRRNAFDLRQKLHKYYESEQPHARIRIELSKGSYAPKFIEVAEPAIQTAPPVVGRQTNLPPVALAVALAVSLLAVAVLAGMVWRSGQRVNSIVRDAWKPVVSNGERVTISVGTLLHLVVRPHMVVVAEGLPKYPAPPELYPFFRQHRPLEEGAELSMHPVDNSVQFGHAQAITVAATTLTLMGAPYQILPERSAPAPALRGHNVILIADPQNSNEAAQRLESAPLTLDFDASRQDVVVRERAGAQIVWAGKRGQDKRYTEEYGLITVLPAGGEGAATHHVLIFSGMTSVGTQGAAEFFARPESLRVLREKLKEQGYSDFPSAYQVVVRCASNDTLLLSADYAAHRVIAR